MQLARPSNLLRLMYLLPVLLLACSDSPGDRAGGMTSEEGVLRYVPADTPYVFAALEPLPGTVRSKLTPHVQALVRSYAEMLQAVVAQRADGVDQSGIDDETRQRIDAVIQELAGMITVDGIPEAGIDPESTAVVYGVGLLPVIRVALSDTERFEAAVSKLESRAGAKMETATIDGHAYRHAGNDEARVIVAVIDDQLVIVGVPAELPEAVLKAALGLTLPRESIAQSGALASVADKYGLTAHALGFIDVERVAATFIDDPAGVNAELLALMEYDAGGLSDVCKAEMRSIAAIAPRVVTGYTDITPQHFKTTTVVELRSDIATGMQALTAAVPGLGTGQGGLISLGMSLNMLAAREFYAARLDAIEADPYECEMLDDVQAAVAQGRALLAQPLPPAVYAFRGFLAVVDDIKGMDLQNQQPPTDIDMRVLVATDNPEALLATGAMFSPEIAALNLRPDSKPVKLAVPAMAAMIKAAWVAMSEDAIALSVGAGSENGLEAMLGVASRQPPPFMSMSLDAARYYTLVGDIAMHTDSDEAPEVTRANAEIMKNLGQLIDRISFDVEFTEHGIQMPSTMTLTD